MGESEAKELINLVIPGVAVALVFILQILTELRNHTLTAQSATDAATRFAMYAAAIAALEVLTAYEPQIQASITPIASAFGMAELYRAARMLISGTGDKALGKALEKEIPAIVKSGDPFAAAK